ncbi:MAG TPA: molybdenum cofactor guanylyltransferase [Anaerolineales bacterium]|nr:molybdenum cofactor guanylyltransferase [Anaerolineales bacterium]
MKGISLVLQAGGKSTRMGRDKALVSFQGMTMIEYILQQTKGLTQDTIVITNTPEDYRFLNLPLFPDVIPDWGALGGLYTAIACAPQETCLVLACDMPFVNRPLLEHLLALLPGHDAAIPHLDPTGNQMPAFAEPFRAVYRKSCLTPIQTAIETGQRRIISFFHAVNIRFVNRGELEQFDPELRTFFNVNTPEDLEQAERIARQMYR